MFITNYNLVVASLNNATVTSNTNILQSNFNPPYPGTLKITVSVSSQSTFLVIINGNSFVANNGQPLNPNDIYYFEMPVVPGFSYNFQFGSNTTVTFYVIYNSQ